MTGVILRSLHPPDIPAVAALSRQCFGVGAWREQDFQPHPARLIWVAELPPGQLAGFVVLQILGDEGEIQSLAVEPAVRRQGIATALTQRALGLARQAGVAKMYLEVREQGLYVQAFYRRFGFVVAGRRAHYYRDPEDAALLMRLEVGQATSAAAALSP